MPKQNQEQEHASEYSLKTFPKRDRRNRTSLTRAGPANFIIELVPHSESTPPLRDLSPEALVWFVFRSSTVGRRSQVHWLCETLSLPSRLLHLPPVSWDRPVATKARLLCREPSRIEEYASHWFTQSSSLHYGEDHMLHMDSRRFFLPSSIRTFLVSPPPIRGLVYPDASVGMGFALYSSHAFWSHSSPIRFP